MAMGLGISSTEQAVASWTKFSNMLKATGAFGVPSCPIGDGSFRGAEHIPRGRALVGLEEQ